MTQFRGIFGILTASYKEDMSLDEKSVRSQVDFCVKACERDPCGLSV